MQVNLCRRLPLVGEVGIPQLVVSDTETADTYLPPNNIEQTRLRVLMEYDSPHTRPQGSDGLNRSSIMPLVELEPPFSRTAIVFGSTYSWHAKRT